MATIVADSAGFDDVQAAYLAAAPGDTVKIPAGDVTWGASLSITKLVTLQGAGVGNTIIRRTGTSMIGGSYNVVYHVDGLELRLTHTNNSANILFLSGRGHKISNCKFVGETSKVVGTIWRGGTLCPHPSGVVWNCTYESARVMVQGDSASTPGYVYGRRIWADLDDVVSWGMEHTVFIEDCIFDATATTGNITDAEIGGHYVIRYCDITGGGVFVHGISSNGERGTRQIEVYGNTMHYEGTGAQDPPIRVRGGTALIWGNTITGGWTNWSTATIMLDNELQRFGNDIGDGNEPVENGTGSHTGGTSSTVLTDSGKSWTPSAFVGWTVYNLTDGSLGTITANTATTVTVSALSGGSDNQWESGDSYKVTSGYPTRDQVGRGKDAEFWVLDTPGPAQELVPVYQWNNTRNGFALTPSDVVVANNSGGWIQLNRDYYNAEFTYTPYPYPHPLRGTAAAPVVTSNPTSATRDVGQSVTFSITASGNPTPTYQWRKAGVNISGATSSSYTIASVQLSDAADYDCVVANSEGADTSGVATLTVNSPSAGVTGPGGRGGRRAIASMV